MINNNPIVAQSPTRIDLCGGTLDCWPLYLLAGPSTTINLSIDIYTQASIQSSDKFTISIKNLEYKKEFAHVKDLIACPDEELNLIKPLINHFQIDTPFALSTNSASPVGAGLGASSSLCISLIKVFCKWLGIERTTSQMVLLASHLEAGLLQKPVGTQDYFPAIEFGLNIIDYGLEGAQVTQHKIDPHLFKDHVTLVFTGKTHNSGINNWQVIQAAINKDKKTLEALKQLAIISQEMKSLILQNNWQELPRFFKKETQARIQLSEGFSSHEIKELEELAVQEGADGVKICGAGGGGCVFIWSSKDKKKQIEEICKKKGFQILKAQAVMQ